MRMICLELVNLIMDTDEKYCMTIIQSTHKCSNKLRDKHVLVFLLNDYNVKSTYCDYSGKL